MQSLAIYLLICGQHRATRPSSLDPIFDVPAVSTPNRGTGTQNPNKLISPAGSLPATKQRAPQRSRDRGTFHLLHVAPTALPATAIPHCIFPPCVLEYGNRPVWNLSSPKEKPGRKHVSHVTQAQSQSRIQALPRQRTADRKLRGAKAYRPLGKLVLNPLDGIGNSALSVGRKELGNLGKCSIDIVIGVFRSPVIRLAARRGVGMGNISTGSLVCLLGISRGMCA